MALFNTPNSYGSVAKFLHWLIALLVIVMLVVGFFLGDVPEEYQGLAYNLHKLTGVAILLLALIRTLWAMVNVKPTFPRDMPAWQSTVARVVHLLLYITVIAMPLCGWIGASLAGHPPQLGSMELGLPLAKNVPLAGFMFDLHGLIAYTLIALITLHTVAALYHHIIRRDRILRRMLPGG